MTSPNPKAFNTWAAGDEGNMSLTARDADGNAVNISGVFLLWGLATDETASGTLLSTQSYPASGITMGAGNGVDGVFNVAMSGVADGLAGTYYQEAQARISDSWQTVVVGTVRITPTIL